MAEKVQHLLRGGSCPPRNRFSQGIGDHLLDKHAGATVLVSYFPKIGQ